MFAESNEEKQLIVVFNEDLSTQEREDAIEDIGGHVTDMYEQVPVASIKVYEDSAIDELEKNLAVKHVEEDIIITKSTQVEDWGILSTNTQLAWNSGLTGRGVKVAVLDSGIAAHSDLVIKGGVSTVDYTSSYHDDQGHGTHVAGIIGARNNSIGVKGVAYESDIYAVKAFNQDGVAFLSDIIEGIDWSISNDIDIINISAGTQTDSAAFRMVADRAYESGLLIVAAAGNDGAPDGLDDTVDFPARYPSVIGVGAVDSNHTRATFSSTGPAVEVAAPGVRIMSTYLGDRYAYMSGTSMATPYVAGELALLKQAYPSLSNKELRAILIEYTRDLGPAGRDAFFGYGLIQASSFTESNVVEEVNPATSIRLSTNTLSGSPGNTFNVTATVTYKNGNVQTVTNEATWTSDNPAIATIANGNVTLKGYGSTTLTASYEGQTAVIIVTVPEPPAQPAPIPAPTPVPSPAPELNTIVKLEADKTSLLGTPGETITVTAKATFKNGAVQNVTNLAKWSSANTSVATVENGKVEIKGFGSTTITVTYEDQSTMAVVNSPEPKPVPEIIKFQDVNSFYSPAVDYLVRNQVTRGLSKTDFGVTKDIIRVDAAIWLARELGLNLEKAKASGFTDVPDRAVQSVNALKEAGIVGGKTATQFGASGKLTRGEAAIILQRAYKLSVNGSTSSFTDVSTRYKDSVNALVANDITDGISATRFGVSEHITRGQLAVFMYRLSGK